MDLNEISQDSLGIITKAELDVAITTAKAYPRDIRRFIDKTIQDVTMSQEIASKCSYSLPRRDKNGNPISIEGASVHLARICCGNYGNLKVAARIISNDGKVVIAQGVCIDMESNFTASIEVRRKITDKNGYTFSEDMQIVTANAACAIAFRNVVFQVVPSAYVEQIREKAKEVAKGTVADLETRRANCLTWYKANGFSERQVCDLAGVLETHEIGIDELFILKNIQESIKSGEQTIHTLFEDEVNPESKQSVSDMANDAYGVNNGNVEAPKKPRANSSNK